MAADITRREFVGGIAAGLAGLAGVANPASANGTIDAPWDELDQLDASGLAELVRRGELGPAELLERAIGRIERLNPVINAVTLRHYDLARASLAGLDRNAPFAGVPFLLKDLWVAMEGTEVTNGSRFFAGLRYDYEGELVRRFRRAGLVILGKTASPELGLTTTTESLQNGDVHNPWKLGRVAGGSSGGSAAAVAAGMVPIAHASDGGGSIRIPASCCGLLGLKPSRGLVPFPIRRYSGWGGLSTHFAVTRSARDAARLLDAVAGPEAGAAALAAPPPGTYLAATREGSSRPLRIARLRAPLQGTPVDPACEQAVDEAAALCRELGHEVIDATPRIDAKAYLDAFGVILAVQTLASIRTREAQLGRPCTEADVETVTWYIAQSALKIDAITYARACDTLDETARQSAAFFESWDLLLSPTLASPPLPLGVLDLSPKNFQEYAIAVTQFSPYASLANVTGQPAISVPLHMSAEGLPVGVMFLGRYAADATLLGLAADLERLRPWTDRRPRFLG